MKRYLSFISAVMIGCITLAPVAKVYALGEEPKAVQVSPEDAAKKYPMPKGTDYPMGINANKGSATASGFVQSPYSARIYDARKMGHGTLILDEGVNKLFRKP
jgi:hypothetical protein